MSLFTYRETLPNGEAGARVLRRPFFWLLFPAILVFFMPLTISNWRFAREQRRKEKAVED